MKDLINKIVDETRLEAAPSVARNLFALGDDVLKIAKVTGLPRGEVEEMRKSIH